MMELSELSVTEFAALLASDAPAPGGGSASALLGALGAALTAMVCALTEGKKRYADFSAQTAAIRSEADALRGSFLDVMRRDTEAFRAVSAVFALPKGTEEERAARKAAMQTALRGCIATPMEMMELADRALTAAEQLSGGYNVSAASDLGVAALSLRAAAQGAWLNVCINLSGLSDREYAAACRERGEALLARVLARADRISAAVLRQISAEA